MAHTATRKSVAPNSSAAAAFSAIARLLWKPGSGRSTRKAILEEAFE